MMKILTTIAFVSTLMVGTAQAEVFYSSDQVGVWETFGTTGNGELNPACVALSEWDDGSDIQFTKDLASQELYIRIYNVNWDMSDEPGTEVEVRINFWKDDRFVEGGTTSMIIINHNTVVVPWLEATKFTPDFMENHVMKFVMPGEVSNIQVSLDGSSAAVVNMAKCMVEYDSKNPSGKNTSTVPGKDA